MKIKTRIFIYVFLSFATILIITSLIGNRYLYKLYLQEAINHETEVAKTLSFQSEDLILTDDLSSLASLYKTTLNHNNHVEYIFLEEDNNVVVNISRKGIPEELLNLNVFSDQSNLDLIPIENQDGSLFYHYRVKIGNPSFATLHIGLSEQQLKADILPLQKVMVFATTSLLLVISFCLAWALSYIISKPIYRLRQGAQRLGKGELGYRLNITTGDEIGQLAEEFNKMSVELEKNYASLEQKVAERTETLQKEILEHTRTEDEFKEIKDHLNNVIESSLDSVVITNTKGYVTKVNKSLLKLLGCEEKGIIGRHIAELSPLKEGTYESTTGELVTINKEFFNDMKEWMSKLVKEKKVSNLESYLIGNNNNQLIPVEESIVYLYDQEGDIIGAVGIIRDTTERKKAEKEFKETKDFLKDVFNTSVDGIMVTDSKGCILRVNGALEQMLGFQKDELIGKYTSELGMQDEERKKAREVMFRQLYEKGYVKNWETMWCRKDGSLCPVEISITFIKDKDANISGAVGVIRDITERKKVEEALREEKEFSNMIIETADVLIVGVNREGRVILFNRKAEELTGYSRAEISGKDFIKTLFPEEGNAAFERMIQEIMAGKSVNFLDVPIRTKQGETLIINSRGTPLRDRDSNIIGVLGIGTDVTALREAQEKLIQSEKLKSLGELAGGVAHDFNNVLAAILGRAQLLKMSIEPPPRAEERRKSLLALKKGLEVIENAARDGAETVRRIQEFARKRDDDKHFTIVDVNELINHALEFTQARWKDDAETKGVKFNILRELPPVPPVKGSAAELREVFTNFINNAVDAMPQGGDIKIKTFMDNGYICIRVIDTGIGISQTIRGRIFDPFFTTKGPQSSGLGLSVSYGIIVRHQGTITVDDTRGKGTAFTIRLPLADEVGEQEKKGKKAILSETKKEKARVLVIEDENDVRQLLSDILTDSNHDVETASSGSEGIELFKNREFDMVFTDLGMPEMSGWDVAKEVKKINEKIPVALITGWNVELDTSEMKDKRVDLIIHKPFEINQVLRLVKEGMILKDRFKAA